MAKFLSMSEAGRRAGVHFRDVQALVAKGTIQRHIVSDHRHPVIHESDVQTIAQHAPKRDLPPVKIAVGVPFTDPTPSEIRERCREIRQAQLQRIPDPTTTHYVDAPRPMALVSTDSILRRFRAHAVRHARQRRLAVAG